MEFQSISDINKHFGEEFQKVMENYKEALKKLLSDNGLNEDVVDGRSGKVGRLVVVPNIYSTYGYEIKFYPYTKNKILSKNASGYVLHLYDFEADKKEG